MRELEAVAAAVPYSRVSWATQLGTGMSIDSGTVTAGAAMTIVVAALVATVVVVVATASILDRRDIR